MKHFRKLNLIQQFLYLMVLMLIIIFTTFVMTDIIVKNIVEKKVVNSMNTILYQIEENMTTFNKDMQGIATFLLYSPTTQEYLEADQIDRILMNKEMISVLSKATSFKGNIRGIQIYDNKGNALIGVGEKKEAFITISDSSINYTGLLTSTPYSNDNGHKSVYTIKFPAYQLDNNHHAADFSGILTFHMDAENFRRILINSKLTKNSRILLLDQQGRTIVSEGSYSSGEVFNLSEINEDKYMVQTLTMPYSEWGLVSIIPKNELTEDFDLLKKFNIITYIVVAVILFLFLSITYSRIIKPIKSLIEFMKSYPNSVGGHRFQVVDYNEIGVLGDNLNKMLDEINNLNTEVNNAQVKMLEIELSKRQMEISAFRNQINPHFLYNTLESIRAVALYYDVVEIGEISEALSNMFRYAVKGSNFVPISDEIKHVKEYAKIIDFRFRERFSITFDVDDEQLIKEKMLKVVLQPIVENAVYHGLERKLGNGEVKISFRKVGDKQIQLTVQDNGYGMNEEELLHLKNKWNHYKSLESKIKNDTKGIGLLNIYRRIKLFYGDEAFMDIQSELGEGTTVMIHFPIKINEEEGLQ
ncbi:sensor histidine kinase [Metabacillus halosaccharovorans]|uniref:sensor histidine kinase n=1 Tax=Metabacillus halosaccharovorans TaxID=930124 RepID=UPI00203C0C47|nr:sensor histidine kinase [Metabacillus halosaccharovorans]MCM3443668.1 histidine kinase [Metabacillus halosaccharovorans]